MPSNSRIGTTMRLHVDGLGILLYSPFGAAGIRDGEDYLSGQYSSSGQVVPHVLRGDLVAFGTGSPGDFRLDFFLGYPHPELLRAREFKLRLGIEVRDGVICVRDIYDLLKWSQNCPEGQRVGVGDGFYHVTVCSDVPRSGVLGDDQQIEVFLKPLDRMPELSYTGIPVLCV